MKCEIDSTIVHMPREIKGISVVLIFLTTTGDTIGRSHTEDNGEPATMSFSTHPITPFKP